MIESADLIGNRPADREALELGAEAGSVQVFGVVPEFQGTGIDSYMIVEGAKLIQGNRQYEELELQWQGDFNPRMLNISKNLGATKSRNLATYRYLFDRTKEFKRHPML